MYNVEINVPMFQKHVPASRTADHKNSSMGPRASLEKLQKKLHAAVREAGIAHGDLI